MVECVIARSKSKLFKKSDVLGKGKAASGNYEITCVTRH